MTSPDGDSFTGRFEQQSVHSPALEGNPLGDPADRTLWVYLPPAYDQDAERRFPAIYLIQGFTGQVAMWWNRQAFRPNVPQLVDTLFSSSDVPPTIVVFVDAWTSLGGSQFVNSPGTGQYMDYLCDDVVGFVDATYRTLASRDYRALTGKSSGGYGAMVVPMLRADVWGALGSHAGDALFDYCYMPDIAVAARTLRDRYGGSYERFWEDFRSRPAFSSKTDAQLLNTYAMAACYSAAPDGTVILPFDPDGGRLRDEVWERWLELDPVRMAPRFGDALRSMRGIYLDAGVGDEYYLDVGASAFAAELTNLGVEHVFELFEGGHGGIEYRYPRALRYLAEHIVSP